MNIREIIELTVPPGQTFDLVKDLKKLDILLMADKGHADCEVDILPIQTWRMGGPHVDDSTCVVILRNPYEDKAYILNRDAQSVTEILEIFLELVMQSTWNVTYFEHATGTPHETGSWQLWQRTHDD